jgi:hypothetical protein
MFQHVAYDLYDQQFETVLFQISRNMRFVYRVSVHATIYSLEASGYVSNPQTPESDITAAPKVSLASKLVAV